jgi:hypothetical protein
MAKTPIKAAIKGIKIPQIKIFSTKMTNWLISRISGQLLKIINIMVYIMIIFAFTIFSTKQRISLIDKLVLKT